MSHQSSTLIRRFQKTIYIRFTQNWISVACVEDEHVLEDIPIAARKESGKVIALGTQIYQLENQAQQPFTIVAPFGHPRTCISDYDITEYMLRSFIRAILPRMWVKPVMVIHPLVSYEGGLTQVELYVLSDLLLNLGARQGHVWIGRQLTYEELRSLEFPTTEGTLFSHSDRSNANVL